MDSGSQISATEHIFHAVCPSLIAALGQQRPPSPDACHLPFVNTHLLYIHLKAATPRQRQGGHAFPPPPLEYAFCWNQSPHRQQGGPIRDELQGLRGQHELKGIHNMGHLARRRAHGHGALPSSCSGSGSVRHQGLPTSSDACGRLHLSLSGCTTQDTGEHCARNFSHQGRGSRPVLRLVLARQSGNLHLIHPGKGQSTGYTGGRLIDDGGWACRASSPIEQESPGAIPFTSDGACGLQGR